MPPELVVVEPAQRWPKLEGKSLWRHRDLAYFMSWRDIKVRYKQSLIGFGWALLQPLVSMVVFTLVFSKVGHVSSQGVPYPVFVLAGIVPWNLFSNALQGSGASMVANMPLVTKVYFPRVILPVSGALTCLVDFLVATLLLLVVMLYYGVVPQPTALLLPFLALLILVTALGVGFWAAALVVKYRDIQQILPFLVSIWLFLTPVVYPGNLLTSSGILRVIYSLNPMVGVVELFRWALVGVPLPPATLVVPSFITTIVLFTTGFVYFTKTEQSFADVI
ncbi:MAG TPA: ABC transporter permease [Actinomycetota bacterium]